MLMHHILRQVGNFNTIGFTYATLARGLQACQQSQHGTFTRAILTCKPNPVLDIYKIAYVFEQGKTAEIHRYVVNRNHFEAAKLQHNGEWAYIFLQKTKGRSLMVRTALDVSGYSAYLAALVAGVVFFTIGTALFLAAGTFLTGVVVVLVVLGAGVDCCFMVLAKVIPAKITRDASTTLNFFMACIINCCLSIIRNKNNVFE
jgi:hypothetical protein